MIIKVKISKTQKIDLGDEKIKETFYFEFKDLNMKLVGYKQRIEQENGWDLHKHWGEYFYYYKNDLKPPTLTNIVLRKLFKKINKRIV